uniref:Uncharacterized protein n=1 Tax=Erwinia amylovora ATCC BAA-2158 TaxID=889211 RepID=E5B1E2_ERWAM|nr:hypothetical protein predicted by Glimmer/Critica [Erwinia amylovora ATCC BAA-2158]
MCEVNFGQISSYKIIAMDKKVNLLFWMFYSFYIIF